MHRNEKSVTSGQANSILGEQAQLDRAEFLFILPFSFLFIFFFFFFFFKKKKVKKTGVCAEGLNSGADCQPLKNTTSTELTFFFLSSEGNNNNKGITVHGEGGQSN